MENALALGADEGRDKLRKATGSSKYTLIRGCPNVGTHMMKNHVTYYESNSNTWGTRGTETSKYPEEKKSNEIPQVVASERGRGQTRISNKPGVRTVKTARKLTEQHGKADRRV